MSTNTAVKNSISQHLQAIATKSLAQGATDFLVALGYRSDKTADLGNDAETLLGNIEQFRPDLGAINRAKVHASRWKSCTFLFQLSNDEIPSLALGQLPLGAEEKLAQGQIESFVFLALDLQGEGWSRGQLATITRELNKRFPMPAIILFRQEGLFSLAVIDRRQNLRDASRDVIESRITVIKDVRLASPHRAHIDILASLALQNLGDKRRPGNFRELYDAWVATLSTQKLNKDFYQQLAWWYLWATKEVDFPKGGGPDRNAIGVIRLLTRLIFVWFIKERGLVPEALFDRAALQTLLKQAPDAAPDDSNYYHAILQNLFFATLNQEMGAERRWAKTGSGMKGDYLISLVYRYQDAFQHPDKVLQDSFASVPFLNGGLFECLDEQLTEEDLARRPELKELVVQEGKGWVLRVDGFSRRPEAQAKVPNKLFFGGTEDAALNTEFETRGKRYPVQGLIDLLDSYKFTVDENTPLDEEVALDPELLGKVFENLLASYNPDTKTTARKQSGSFYTPREVVDYMVDEALIAYFAGHLPDGEQRERDLRQLLSHADAEVNFSPTETDALVTAIEQLKALDPACGSGAFPMGILAKLFVALQKLDPDNHRWRAQNLSPLEQRLALAKKTPDPVQRDAEIEDAEAALQKHKKDFADSAYADYTRKLYLIEKCIFGSDIQPIAVQIAKLRFFIALIVSQPIDKAKPNYGITALPNLETKIVAANTLFGVPRHGAQGSLLDDPAIAEKEAELRDANAAYFTARTRATKKRRKEKVQKLHEELVALLQRDGFVTARDAERMARWNPFDQNRFADFFDVEWMFGMPRAADHSEAVFDIVIANPPYVRQEEIKDLKPLLKDVYQYECYTGTADLFVYFYERSVKLLKPHGALSFITSNKWYRAKYGENLRLFMATHTRLKNIIDFGDEAVFTAIAYPTIVIATRRERPLNPAPASDQVRALNWAQTHPVEEFPAVFQAEAFAVPQAELKKEGWQLEPPGKRALLARIRNAGTPLGQYVNGRFYYGIKTGLNEAFVIDGVTRARLVAEDPKSAEVIKPFLRGRDVKRWGVEFEDQYLIKIESSENVPHPWSGKKDAEKVFANCYPAIHAHFQDYRQAMIDRYDQGKYFWELRACVYWQEFEQPKIVYPDIYLHQSFAWDTEGYYAANTCYFIPTEERWLTGVLNSSLIEWFYEQIANRIQNGYLRAFSDYMKQVPVSSATAEQKLLVDVGVGAALIGADVRYEQLINGLVFELFFPEDLHAANIRLFDACEQAGVGKLADLQGDALAKAAQKLAATLFANDHPIYAMLFDLQALEVVRIIEGRE
ncbi:MAG: Eco57I restriction-modification methylase domain-containing protein [Proteobacteria bacterium]|nr:Eco57I restriction-modification methylase domain-containing protein [Pseudomonadota bacterium]MBS0492732.1 Eco57I restriction-modification methylase domain-containing protein [Pseudomonadota bacterium]